MYDSKPYDGRLGAKAAVGGGDTGIPMVGIVHGDGGSVDEDGKPQWLIGEGQEGAVGNGI